MDLFVLCVLSLAVSCVAAQVSVQPTDPVVFENQTLTLTCNSTSPSPLNFSWFRDGAVLPGEMNSKLTVPSVPLEWAGSVLVCAVEGVGNSSVSLTVNMAAPVIAVHPQNRSVDQGSGFDLSCVAVGNPSPRIQWYQDGSLFTLPFINESNGSLVIPSASDEFAGVYHCRAWNIHGVAVSDQAFVSVRFPPEFTVQPVDLSVLNNTAASLNCSAKGNPPPTITWLHNGEVVTPGDRVSILANGSLAFDTVTMMDMGVYRCVANNSLGAVDSDTAMLLIDLSPRFLVTPNDKTVAIGDTAFLNCTAMAIPSAEYDWTRNGMSVDVDDVRVWVEDNGAGGELLTFSEVRRSDAGTYVCIARNIYGSIQSPEVQLMVSGPPLPPVVTLGGVGGTWLSVSWVRQDSNPPITSDTVQYRLTFDPNFTEVVGIMDRGLNLTSLYPNADYVVQVVSVSPAGSSSPAVVMGTRTLPGLPMGEGLKNSPDNFSIEHTSPHHLMVHWTVPQELLQTSYNRTRVYIKDMEGSEIIVKETTESPVSVTDLTPATPYTVEVAFLFVGGHTGPRTRRDVTTMDGLPSSPENVTVVPDRHTLTVTWAPPTQPNGTITAYTLITTLVTTPVGIEVVVGGNETAAVIGGLTAYTNYTVTVSANTSAGEGEGQSRDTRTAEDVPPAPNGLTAVVLNSTALSLSWQPLRDVPGVLLYYTVSVSGVNGNVMTFDLSDTSYVLTGLAPYTLYQLMVAGVTGAGKGNFSDPVDRRTLSDVPTSVPNVTRVDLSCPNDLVVAWMNPDPFGLNGPVDDTDLVLMVVSEIDSTNITREYSDTGSYTIKNVTHFTNYSVSMAIRNDNGTGGFSNVIAVMSCDALADPPAIMSIEVNSKSIRVTWQPVGDFPGVLTGFVVYYNEVNVSAEANRTSALLLGLVPYTSYRVGVASVSRSGVGTPSTTITRRTLADVPTLVPMVTRVEPSCPNDLVVTWMNSDPSGLNGPPDETVVVVGVVSSNTVRNCTEQYNSSGSGVVRVTGLARNTGYNVTLAFANYNGTGPLSTPVTAHTLTEGLPTPPRNVTTNTTSSTSITVSWQPPLNPNGDPGYLVFYRRNNSNENVIPTRGQSATLTGLQVFTDYEIAVSANTSCGMSDRSEVIVGQTPPTQPQSLNVTAVLPTAVVLEWAGPVGNGTVSGYYISCGSYSDIAMATTYECTGLDPATEYTVGVAAVNDGGRSPLSYVETMTACEDQQPMVEAGNDDRLIISLPSSTQGNCTRPRVLYVLVLVRELVANGNIPTRPFNNYTLEDLLESTRNYGNSRSKRQDDGVVYIAANVSEAELQGDAGFAVGDGQPYGGFTNFHLRPGVSYNIGLWGVVAGATTPVYAQSVSGPFTSPTMPTTPTSFPIVVVAASAGAAAVVLFAILLLICIICACSYCNKRASKYIVSNGTGRLERSSSFRLSAKKKAGDPVDEFRANHRTEALEDHPPVPVAGFINKLFVMRTNDNQLFLEEFGSISSTPLHSTEVADSNANKKKNRYNNILPYDNNRVKLKSQGGSDYINASYCSGYMKNKAYIATQGPVAETVGDFWRLVWEENVHTIVMLTNVTEKGKVKCETYWPRDLGCSSVHGHTEVIMDQVTQLADFTIRTFSLHKSGSSKDGRTVKQFHFTSWPDHGVPQYATAMLSMLRRVRSYHSKVSGGPMLVHCSAGVGRTGTFIVIDSMLERIRNSDPLLDIYGHVTLLRTQRNFMVQTEDQYFFIHEAIAEALLCGNTEVPLERLGGYVTELGSTMTEDDSTLIEVQFKRLAIDKNDPYRYVTANKDSNKHKNRLVNILPYETNRVVLEYMRGVDGSDYINASHIDSYHNQRAFIATQGPLPHTSGDFWRMVWQYNSPVIVMLTELVEKGQERCSQYWPAEVLQSERHDRFSVELTVERRSEQYTFRDISLTDTQSGQKRNVSHFQFHGWPEVGIPTTPTNLLDFIREVQKMYSILNTRSPITVHCSSGVGRTGVFITLHITLERMVTEGLVDIFQTVKNLRIQRPAMVQSLQQYQFCYESALHYLESSDLLTRQRTSRTSTEGLTRKRSLRHTPPSSQASPARTSGATPSRTESFKGSTRNFEMSSNNHGAQIYGGSEATSTFGSHPTTTNASLTHGPSSGSQTLASPHSGSQSQLTPHTGSQSYLGPLAGSQSQLAPYGSQSQLGYYGNSQPGGSHGNSQSSSLQRYGGSQSQLSSPHSQSHLTTPPHSSVHSRNASVGGVASHMPHQLLESQRYSGGWGAETQ